MDQQEWINQLFDDEEQMLGLALNGDVDREIIRQINRNDFKFLRHHWVFEAIKQVEDEYPVTIDTVCYWLKEAGNYFDVGGMKYLELLQAHVRIKSDPKELAKRIMLPFAPEDES